ncbi:hypothetical protein [Olivibacter sitiensis]|uniref:hypothetical protein n=1 Tax=Olivibacter sitiensis TaxID=376470 RepID=UPI0003F5B131|nr:hypothetical protein [Olivibacter sitiensis]
MNANKRVFLFVLFSLLIYILLSLASYQYGFYWKPFDKINLLADVVVSQGQKGFSGSAKKNDRAELSVPPQFKEQDSLLGLSDMLDSLQTLSATPRDSNADPDAGGTVGDKALIPLPDSIKHFLEISAPKQLIASTGDLTQAALPHVMAKLEAIKEGKPKKLRIAYLGDSMIEGDLLSQTLRSLLQKQFGGRGVGFVPVTSPVAQFRQTVTATTSGSAWRDIHFKNSKRGNFFFNGHMFFSSGAAKVRMRDNTYKDSSGYVSKYLLYSKSDSVAHLVVNGREMELAPGSLFNKKLLSKDKGRNIEFSSLDTLLPIYGVTFESENGVFVDNFSFRGISGLEFGQLKADFMRQVAKENPYDLIIIQFGINVLYHADDTNFNWYKKLMIPVINRMKAGFPNSDFLIVSSSDRAFFYDGEYRSAKGVKSLVRTQAEIAYMTGCAFYNQFEAMGGENSIIDWANQDPSLANKDYVHPNGRGMKILGTYLFDAFMKDLGKLKRSEAQPEEEAVTP